MDDAARRMAAQLAERAKALVAQQPKPPTVAKPPPLPPLKAQAEGVATEAKPKVKRSKKLDLAKLPKQWRATVFGALHPERTSPLASAVAVLWATGCRPVELEKGVKVSMQDGQLLVEIQGAKVGKIDNGQTVADRGLEWRKLKLSPDLNAATQYLARLVADGPQTVAYNKASLRTRLNETGRLAIRKLPEGVSIAPYSFRHALGSDLKSCDDYTDEQRAMVMGHLSVESLSVYGRRRHRGGVKPVASVEASAVPHGDYTDAPKGGKKGSHARR